MSSIYVTDTYYVFMDLKTLLLYKVVYRLSIIPIKTPVIFFFQKQKFILNSWNLKGSEIKSREKN